jgi:excisionase family DNA binding protein
VAQRKLPAYKVGSQWRFNRTLLESWLEKNLNAPANSNNQ